MKLPTHIEGFIKAQNEKDSTTFTHYFTDNATVYDEGHSYSGRAEIRKWIQHATETYQMQTKPIDYQQAGASAILTVEVRETFPGSPAVMKYHLELDDSLIRSLRFTG
ncbi:nuclear transport factor 2 family protein [Spirosoma oryzicola]|uniref:nuclear transport factor 2 family protein n=1 Tax=Spirosoma oryzicola TaxID=2898794 RepID=UPI001E4786A4|nr:nuclear transport factor 2 family protein [Spirosoma oryzicola]UHG93980.1 nuclear transport factor 2 family protein [Spirosoma oryzicola]